MNWRAGIPGEIYRQRARFLQLIREFFHARDVVEVETPLLSPAATTDPALESFRCEPVSGQGADGLWLHTSPEFYMKRLLAQGSGDIYQVCKVFRREEKGTWHHPEFTLLEWYRTDMDYHKLMRELADLVCELGRETGKTLQVEYRSYESLFTEAFGLNPHTAGSDELRRHIDPSGFSDPGLVSTADRNLLLQILMSSVIEPALKPDGLTMVYDYPAGQAALARIRRGAYDVAERFELYWGPLELANGFQELTSASEQATRFEKDLALRQQNGQRSYPLDREFLAALEHGLPECAGVAVGLDRLFARLLDKNSLAGVTGFL